MISAFHFLFRICIFSIYEHYFVQIGKIPVIFWLFFHGILIKIHIIAQKLILP